MIEILLPKITKLAAHIWNNNFYPFWQLGHLKANLDAKQTDICLLFTENPMNIHTGNGGWR